MFFYSLNITLLKKIKDSTALLLNRMLVVTFSDNIQFAFHFQINILNRIIESIITNNCP